MTGGYVKLTPPYFFTRQEQRVPLPIPTFFRHLSLRSEGEEEKRREGAESK